MSTRLVGHINLAESYPATVVPVCEELDAHGATVSVSAYYGTRPKEDVGPDEYVRHTDGTSAQLEGFDVEEHFLYAATAIHVLFEARDEEQKRKFFGRLLESDPDVAQANPLVRLELARRTNDPFPVADALRACAEHVLAKHKPESALRWFLDSAQPLLKEWSEKSPSFPIPADSTLKELALSRRRIAGIPARIRRTVAILVDELGAYQMSVLLGMAAEAENADINLAIVLTGTLRGFDPSKPSYGIHQLVTHENVDGVLLMSGTLQMTEGELTALASYYDRNETGIPLLSVAVEVPGVPGVVVDAKPGLLQAVAHLVKLGHKRIAFIRGPSGHQEAERRRRVVEDELKRLGLFDEALIVQGDFLKPSGRAAMEELANRGTWPDAVITANDAMAIGVLEALKSRPDQKPVAVIGYDDLPFAAVSVPPLTTVRQPLDELGRESVSRLTQLMRSRSPNDQDAKSPSSPPRDLFTELVFRESCPETLPSPSGSPRRSHRARQATTVDREQQTEKWAASLGIRPTELKEMLKLSNGPAETFLQCLREHLARSKDEAIPRWNAWLEELRHHLLAQAQSEPERLTLGETTFGAVVLINERFAEILDEERSRHLAKMLDQQARTHVLATLADSLARAQSTSTIVETLARYIPSVSKTCALCQHEETTLPLKRSRLRLGVRDGQNETSGLGSSFDVLQLVPPGLLKQTERQEIVIAPLRRDEPLGYFVFDLKTDRDWQVCQEVAGRVSHAFPDEVTPLPRKLPPLRIVAAATRAAAARVTSDHQPEWRALRELAAHVGRALHQAKGVEQQALGQQVLTEQVSRDRRRFEAALMPFAKACAEQTLEALDAAMVTVFPYFEQEAFFPVAHIGPGFAGSLLEEETTLACPEIKDDDAPKVVLDLGKDLYVPDTANPPPEATSMFARRSTPRFTERQGVKSLAGLLLRHHSTVVGVMFVNYRDQQNFETLRERMSICAASVASTLWERVRSQGSIEATERPASGVFRVEGSAAPGSSRFRASKG